MPMDVRTHQLKSFIKTHLFTDPQFQEIALTRPVVGLFCRDLEDQDIEYVSSGFWLFLGLPPHDQDSPPKDWRQYLHTDDREKAQFSRQGSTTLRFLTPKGTVELACQVLLISHQGTGKRFRVIVLSHDTLGRENGIPDTVVSQETDAVFFLDTQQCILKMNTAAELLTGRSENDSRKKDINTVLTLVDQKTGTDVSIPETFYLHEYQKQFQSRQICAITRGGEHIPVTLQGAQIAPSPKKEKGSILVIKPLGQVDFLDHLVNARLSLVAYAGSHTLDQLLQKALDDLGGLVDSPIGFIHFVEDDGKTLSLQQWSTRTLNEFCSVPGKGLHYDIDKAGVWVDCVREQKPIIHNDYAALPHKNGLPKNHAAIIRELVVPVMRNDRVVAILGVGNKPEPYTERDVNIVSYFADITWEIVQRKRMDEEIAHQNQVEQELADLSKLLLTQTSLESISGKVLDTAKRLTRAKYGFVGTWDPDTAHLTCHTMSRDIWEDCMIPDKSIVFKECKGLFGWVLANGEPLMLNDIKGDERSSGTPEGHIPIQSFLCVPAKIGNDLVGQISLANPEFRFRQMDLTAAKRLATLFALSVQRQQHQDHFIKVESQKAEELEKKVRQRTRQLTQSKHLLEDVFNSQQDAILVTDAAETPKIINCNPATQRIFGYEKTALLGKSTQVLHKSPKHHQDFWTRLTASGQSKQALYQAHQKMLKKDGSPLTVNVSASCITDTQDRISGWVITLRDDSQQLEYQKKLRRGREKFRAIADYSAGWETWIDPSGTLLWTNPGVEEITGYSIEEYATEQSLYKRLSQLMDPQDLEKAANTLSLVLENQRALKDYHLRIRKKNGSRAWISVSCNPIYGEERDYLGIRASIRDITEKKENEKKVAESEERLNMVVDAMRDGVWDWRMDRQEVYFSPRYYTMLGYEPYEMPQTFETWQTLVHPDDVKSCKETISKAMALGTPFQMEFRMQTKSGQWKWILGRGKTVEKDKKGNPLRMVGTHMDISRRKELDDRLHQAQKLEAVGTLASGIAHDFNNILAGIIGYAELVMDEIGRDSKGYGRLKGIIKSSERARELIRQILTFSRQEETEHFALDVRLVIKEALALIRATLPTTITINQEIQPDLPFVLGDPTQIHQLIMNLSTNALHAMSSGGEMRVSLTTEDLGGQEKTTGQDLPRGKYVKLTVKDSGTGIPPDILPWLFDPFFTTKEKGKGTGLGLSVVHGIVKKHQGDIRIDSVPGQGTRVDIYLPCQEAEKKRNPLSMATQGGGEGKILIVDDEEVLSLVVNDMLESLGYSVTALTDSQEAFELFKRTPADFDILLTDITMPGLTGVELVDSARKLRPDLPVIIWSGDHDKLSQDIVKGADNIVFMKKPFRQQELATTVKTLLS